MFRVAVVGGEKAKDISTVLKMCLEKLGIQYQVREYSMPVELLWDLEEDNYFDVYFIDTELEAMNPLELTENIRKKYDKEYVVWVSSSMKYCIQGYEYQIYRYLMEKEIHVKLPQILLDIVDKVKTKDIQQYVIEACSKIMKIEYRDILYFYVDGKYTYFKTKQEIYRDRKFLKGVFEEAENHTKEFAYVDKGCVVNVNHIIKLENKKITMDNGEVIQVSIPQNQKLKKTIQNYWEDNILKKTDKEFKIDIIC